MRELFTYTMAELSAMSLEELRRHHKDALEYYGDSDTYYAVSNLAYEIENRRLRAVDERMRFLQNEMFIHSYLYYALDKPVIEDRLWDRMANELRVLQENNPKIAAALPHHELFADWDGTTGFHIADRIPHKLKQEAELLSLDHEQEWLASDQPILHMAGRGNHLEPQKPSQPAKKATEGSL